jgi:hypothetical protein
MGKRIGHRARGRGGIALAPVAAHLEEAGDAAHEPRTSVKDRP